MTLRKIIKNRSLFPNDEAIFKLMYVSLKNISKKWTMPIHNWSAAMNQFALCLTDGCRWVTSVETHLHKIF
jgi:transposase-like protein